MYRLINVLRRKIGFIAVSILGIGQTVLWGAGTSIPKTSTPTVTAIEFMGNASLTSDMLEKRLSIKRSSAYSPAQLTFSRELIESIYRDQGYADVQVSTHTHWPSPEQVKILFRVEEGPLFRVRFISIEGNRAISESWSCAISASSLGTRLANPNFLMGINGYFFRDILKRQISNSPLRLSIRWTSMSK